MKNSVMKSTLFTMIYLLSGAVLFDLLTGQIKQKPLSEQLNNLQQKTNKVSLRRLIGKV